MENRTSDVVESNYRKNYGKLFSALFSQFGADFVNEIEDAIQNAFYKSLRCWDPNKIPKNQENWLFVVARNDLLNQIKKVNQSRTKELLKERRQAEDLQEDLRLKTILYLCKFKNISAKVKVIFILKNIFGLHIKEISECTLISEAAIYKSISRAKKDFQKASLAIDFDSAFEHISEIEISLVEEILYAVFNIGFDSFNEKVKSVVNEDLCLEALALVKILTNQFKRETTKNLLALFCFHLARIPAKIKNQKMISFFEQKMSDWDSAFLKLGFHYLEKPQQLNKYYLEALIVSKHMTVKQCDLKHWEEIVSLYQLLISISKSPIMKLNLCYCLAKAERIEEAKTLLEKIESELPAEHIYFSLVKANILKGDQIEESAKLIEQVVQKVDQKIRREYILENMTASF